MTSTASGTVTTGDYTPGPWRIADLIVQYGMFPNDGSSVVMAGGNVVAHANPQLPVKRGKGHEHKIDPERDANARLIAAAPELYEALAAANIFKADFDPETRRKVSAALAKATGLSDHQSDAPEQ
jgi:hypothetical protein